VGALALFGCLLPGNIALAQTPALKFTFEDAPGLTTANSGSASVSLYMVNAANAAADFHGSVGSGVLGSINGNRALDFSSAPNYGGANAPMASVTNSAALGFGTITSFTVTQWFKENQFQPTVNGLLGRMFVLGTGTGQTDINAVNTIGMKWQQPNQWNVSIGNENPTATAIFAANLPTNKWLFMAIVYDGANVMIYQGSDTASANLISTTPAALATHTINLGSAATLYVGNRNNRQRGFAGWIDDFRFYTNYAGSASFVEGIRQEAAPLPAITGVYPNGATLMQATNTLVFNVSSPAGVNITNVGLVLNGVNVSSQLQYVTNGTGGTSTNLSLSYIGLPQNKAANTVAITVTDAGGVGNAYSGTFDTFTSTNFIIEAEEFDHDSGQYIDNPNYTDGDPGGDPNSYYGLESVEGVDTHKGSSSGFNAANYRAGNGDGTRTQTPVATGEQSWPKFTNLLDGSGNPIVAHMIGNWSSAEWQNYTKTFPSGKFNVYARASTASGATITFARVTSGQGTSTQTTTNLGKFTFTGNSLAGFSWVPLRDGLGNPVIVDLASVNTVRATTGGGANADFYMFVPANTNLPTISSVYPNGQVLFQSTNKLVFTVSSPGSTINTSDIQLTLNGSNVSAGLVFSGGPSTWNVSYTGLQINQTYATTISATDANTNNVTGSFTFDTWNPVFQVEAEDFDFSGGQFIDNPAPTTGPAGNSYYGQVGTLGVDEFNQNAVPPYAGASPSNYRPSDPTATTAITDAARQQFITAGASDYNVGFIGPGFWQNYTKTWPTGTFNVYARLASGANIGTIHASVSKVIGGWGTASQLTRHVGSFSIPSTNGYSSYLYAPLIDKNGNYANVTLGGTNTFRITDLTVDQTETAQTGAFGLNANFYMLLNARTDLPRIDNVYPDGSVLMQQTNTFSFVASSPTYGINTTNIHLTLNGNDVSSQLAFSGSSPSWNVSYPGLQPNIGYTAVISITDATNQTRTTTVNFDTYSSNYFTWEAEDWDFDPNASPVPNGSGLRYIDNPVPTSSAATNSYFGQEGDAAQISAEIDYSSIFGLTHPGAAANYIYRPLDYISAEVTSDAPRQKYLNAQLANVDPAIVDRDVSFWATNGWINYTHTIPAGNFYLYARLSAGNGAFNLACAQVTSGAGTPSQVTNALGSFKGLGTSFATWQYVPLVDANTNKITLSSSGVKTLRFTGDYNENVNFFMLVPVLPNSVAITASISGPNILLSFPTQAGYSYTVYYKNTLTDPNWTPLGGAVSGDGTVKTVTDGTAGSSRFYRLSIQ
jgi:hypothetical protein